MWDHPATVEILSAYCDINSLHGHKGVTVVSTACVAEMHGLLCSGDLIYLIKYLKHSSKYT